MNAVRLALKTLLLAPLALLANQATVHAQAVDVAVVTGLSGTAGYATAGSATDRELQAFQQVAEDAVIQLGSGSRTTLVFFTGRKESWEGPVTLRLEADGAVAVGDAAGDSVEVQLAPETSDQFERLPKVMGTSKSAVTVVLAPVALDLPADPDCRHWRTLELNIAERQRLDAAREVFRSLREDANPEDRSAEAYWLSILGQYDQFDEMIALLDELRSRYPDSAVLNEFRERTDRCARLLAGGSGS